MVIPLHIETAMMMSVVLIPSLHLKDAQCLNVKMLIGRKYMAICYFNARK